MSATLVIKDTVPCERCGSYSYIIRPVKMHIGKYCNCCGMYIKWLSKNERKNYNVITETKLDDDLKCLKKEKTLIQQLTIDDVINQQTDENTNNHRKDYEEGLNDEVPWYD